MTYIIIIMKRINVTILDDQTVFLDDFKKKRHVNMDEAINEIIEEHPDYKKD